MILSQLTNASFTMSVNFPMKLHILAYFSCNRHISVATKPDVLGQNGLDFQNQHEKLAQKHVPSAYILVGKKMSTTVIHTQLAILE